MAPFGLLVSILVHSISVNKAFFFSFFLSARCAVFIQQEIKTVPSLANLPKAALGSSLPEPSTNVTSRDSSKDLTAETFMPKIVFSGSVPNSDSQNMHLFDPKGKVYKRKLDKNVSDIP